MAKKFFLAFIIKLSCRHCSRKILKVMYSSWVETFLLIFLSSRFCFFLSLIQCCSNCVPWHVTKVKKPQMKKIVCRENLHLNQMCRGLKKFGQHCFNKCFICISISHIFRFISFNVWIWKHYFSFYFCMITINIISQHHPEILLIFKFIQFVMSNSCVWDVLSYDSYDLFRRL